MTPSILTLDNAPPGIRVSEELVISNDSNTFWLTLTRDNWPDTGEVVCQAGLEISYDDGGKWQYFAEFRMQGGGQDSPESAFSSHIPTSPGPLVPPRDEVVPEPPLRRIRVSVKNEVDLSTTVDFGLE
jgi:hypothetical protein